MVKQVAATPVLRASAVWPMVVAAMWMLSGCGRNAPRTADELPPPAPKSASTVAPSVDADGPPPAPEPSPEPGCTLPAIQKTVRSRLSAVTACYQAAAQANPALAGRVVIELGIERGGILKRRAVFESELPADVGACIVRALDGLAFDGAFATPCIIHYPFVFSTSTSR